MTIVNDNKVFATANIYEKDLSQVKTGQQVSIKVASVPNRTFNGRIAVIGSVVEGETRVVAVKAEIDNSGGVLKPGMFAELEVLTDQTSTATLAIPSSAVVEENGKKQVYVQNGNAYQAVEVSLGQTSGDTVEVKTGLFEGDMIVTQRAPQLYAQSLRGGSPQGEQKSNTSSPSSPSSSSSPSSPVPWWMVAGGGGAIAFGTALCAIATVAFMAGTFWSKRRSKSQFVSVDSSKFDTPVYDTEFYHNNSKSPALSGSTTTVKEHEDTHHPES
jgi:cobalt-zinc-cadmium efflux system membrane fusion protein